MLGRGWKDFESSPPARKVVVLAFPQVKLLDVAGPCEVFAVMISRGMFPQLCKLTDVDFLAAEFLEDRMMVSVDKIWS